jgi:hypothetical protein
VSARICPHCHAAISAAESAAYTNGLECPNCRAHLEVSEGSRMIATWLGLAAGYAAWRLTRDSGGPLGWVLPLVYSFLAFSVVAAIGVMFTADLRSKPPEPDAEPAHSSGGHGAHH